MCESEHVCFCLETVKIIRSIAGPFNIVIHLHIDQLCHLWTLLTFFCSVLCVNLQLSLSLISCIGLSISPLSLFLFLALSSPFRFRSVGTRWPLRLPPNKPPTLLFFSRRSPPPSLFCPCFFLVFPPERQPRAELFSPCRSICSQETQWADVLARLILPLSLSQCLSFPLFHADLKAVVSSGHFIVYACQRVHTDGLDWASICDSKNAP